MNTSSKKAQECAEECCKLANQRYGLTRGMLILMRGMRIDNETKNKIVELAKNREFIAAEELLNNSR